MSHTFDVVILGTGFTGSITAMALCRMGLRVLMVERSRHPRFAIGESTTPMANLLLEELARTYDLPGVLPLCKWGSWQRELPEVGCGLKRGFSFYHHAPDRRFENRPDRRNQLLVAASPHDAIADTHWYRPDVDQHLVSEAIRMGVTYRDQTMATRVDPVSLGTNDRVRLRLEAQGQEMYVSCRLLIDATGPRGALHRLLRLPERTYDSLPATSTIFAHFHAVARLESLPDYQNAELPPYPPDDAAVHHVFDGGWIWILRFENGITSAGAALAPGRARGLGLQEGGRAWQRLLNQFPSIADQFAGSVPVTPFFHQSTMPFRSGCGAGPGWVMLPSAFGFVDPIFSTGFPLALMAVQRLLGMVRDHFDSDRLESRLHEYAHQCDAELTRVASFVAALYRVMNDFPRFTLLARVYFAAVIYSETCRRLRIGTTLEDGFLLGNHRSLAQGFDRCINLDAKVPLEDWEAVIREWVELIDLAGLMRPERRNWIPVEIGDLKRGVGKLGVEWDRVERMLRTSGFFG